VSGTEGYAAEAEALVAQYESLSFADVHRQVRQLFPTEPCDASWTSAPARVAMPPTSPPSGTASSRSSPQPSRARAPHRCIRRRRSNGWTTVFLSRRYGPVPAGRRTFAVSVDETVQLAEREGLHLVLNYAARADDLRRPDVSWTRLAFANPATRR
jgi:hypothetical protein